MSASPPPPAAAAPDTILFRPSKKRKVYRQRAVDLDAEDYHNYGDSNNHEVLSPPQSTDTHAHSTNISTAVSIPARPAAQSLDELVASSSAAATGRAGGMGDGGQVEVEGAEVSMAEILRLRKLRKRVGGGVEFRATNASSANREGGLIRRDEGAESVEGDGKRERGEGAPGSGNGVVRKFAPQTGSAGDVNKHMMAYIDSELAKRRRAEGLQSSQDPNNGTSTTTAPEGTETSTTTTTAGASSHPANSSLGPGQARKSAGAEVQRQPATLGKLQEIDLGDEVRSRNILQTERARRRLGGEDVGEDDDDSEVGGRAGAKKGKVRLGRDGKPWRGRKRRGSEDIKRDKLVEDILRENRLDIYDSPTTPANPSPNDAAAADDDGQAADDRIAEAFRREFMDAVSQRQRKKPGAPAPSASSASASSMKGGKKEEEVLKGPKLGGSRNARAAMRDAMLKAAAAGGAGRR